MFLKVGQDAERRHRLVRKRELSPGARVREQGGTTIAPLSEPVDVDNVVANEHWTGISLCYTDPPP